MKGDFHGFNMRYSGMPCPKDLQRYGPGEGPCESPLICSPLSKGKNSVPVNSDSVKYAAWCYGLRFAPAIVILVFSHLLNVLDLMACASAEVALDGDDIGPSANETESSCPENVESSSSAGFQLCNFVFAFVYLSAISLSFVSRNHQIWQFLPTRAWDETNFAGCVIFARFRNRVFNIHTLLY